MNLIESSKITCPKCGYQATEQMPIDACQYFYDCRGCGARLKPKPGECCVFCSYGSVPCPSVQTENGRASERKSCAERAVTCDLDQSV